MIEEQKSQEEEREKTNSMDVEEDSVKGSVEEEEEKEKEEEEEEEEEEEKEEEVNVYIIHGTMNPDDNKIDNDEELEKRQKYIYDLRYWAWRRLNALDHPTKVEWENVQAFFYRHTDDSVWSRMFSPPIFWSPIEHMGTIINKINEAGFFGKYDFGNTELTETNLSIVKEIAKNIHSKKTVLLYGFSVGGLVVQRICELLNVCIYNEELSGLILGFPLYIDELSNYLKVSTFGSIYISPTSKVENIRIQNYMLVDDVATRTNFFEFGFGYLVPNFDEYDEMYIHYICNSYTNILYEYMTIDNTNITYLHKWTSDWLGKKQKEDIGKKVFTQYRVEELKGLYKDHNSKYDLLFNKLLKSRTNDVEDLPDTCRKPAVNTLSEMPEPEEISLENVEIIEPPQTVDEMIKEELRVSADFYNKQDEYVKRKEDVINKKMKDAEETRVKLEDANKRKEDQKAQRDARAKRREALKELRTDLVDVTEHGAMELINHTNSVDVSDPEEDMLNFANVLAQLEAKSVFLIGDGLQNIRYLTNQAINRAKNYRNMITRIAGGKKKGIKTPETPMS